MKGILPPLALLAGLLAFALFLVVAKTEKGAR